MDDLLARLNDALAPAYRLIKELGGGGMSRVFLAEEVELGRQVVIKVLPPDMSAGVNRERFQREIRLAASLQHPHIVPLLTAGAAGELLYYVMPYIEGESLRARLAREGELPITEAARILRDVVDALAAAHKRGVVHRDIKPDNVMLAGNHALVTDFGVAKAVSASSGDSGSSLTSLGIALGTPAYMSPEQAAADPHTDHRADIYAVGALAYEMLAGTPPFTGPTPQSVLAAHVTQAPEQLTRRRPAVPPAMAELVMRCLEKRPADRWQTAVELLPALGGFMTPTGGMTPTGTAPVAAVSAEHSYRKSHPARVLGFYALASVAVLGVAYFLMMQLGLPGWVFPGAAALLAAGVPIMMITARHERQRAMARMTGTYSATPTGLQGLATWRKAIWGGGVAFGVLALATGVYMAMRLLGIGPVGTLLASGVLSGEDRLLLTDFDNRTADSTLGSTITELFRIDLSESRAVNLLEPTQVQEVLRRMERGDSTIGEPLAREIAAREGVKAYVTGDVRTLGNGFIISTRLVAAGSGDALFSGRETANAPGDVVGAVDRLSAALRERIGESLRDVRADAPLERITTRSTEALRLYTQATKAGTNEQDYRRAVELLRQAVALDSNFAMAWRRLAAFASNAGQGDLSDSAATRAYTLRDRLGERERLQVVATYHWLVADEPVLAIDAYRSLLDKYPEDMTALNNIGLVYSNQGRYAEAEAAERRVVAAGGTGALAYANLASVQARQGRFAAAESTLRLLDDSFPAAPLRQTMPITLAVARADFPEVERIALLARDSVPAGSGIQGGLYGRLSSVYEAWGRLKESRQWDERAGEVFRKVQGVERSDAWLQNGRRFDDLERLVTMGRAPADADRQLEDLWRRQVQLRTKPEDRNYIGAAYLFATVGRPERARQLLDEYRRVADTADVRRSKDGLELVGSWIDLAEGRPESAIRAISRYREENHCGTCLLWELAAAWDRAGSPDSAIATYEEFLTVPSTGRLGDDAQYRAMILRRMGEMYEQRGDRTKALDYYGRFTGLWKNADTELQPMVAQVKSRMTRLAGEPAAP